MEKKLGTMVLPLIPLKARNVKQEDQIQGWQVNT
jgi:hypothetical protein